MLPTYVADLCCRLLLRFQFFTVNSFVCLDFLQNTYEQLQLLPMDISIQVHSPYTTHTYTVVYYLSMTDAYDQELSFLNRLQEHDDAIKERLKKKNTARHQNKARMKKKKFQQKQQKQTTEQHDEYSDTDNDSDSCSSSMSDTECKQSNCENSPQKHDQPITSNNEWTESSSHYYERKQHEIEQEQLHDNNNQPQHKSFYDHDNSFLHPDDVSSLHYLKRMPVWFQRIYDRNGYFIFNRIHASTQQTTTILIPLRQIKADRMTIYYHDHPSNLKVPDILRSLAPTGKNAYYQTTTWYAN